MAAMQALTAGLERMEAAALSATPEILRQMTDKDATTQQLERVIQVWSYQSSSGMFCLQHKP